MAHLLKQSDARFMTGWVAGSGLSWNKRFVEPYPCMGIPTKIYNTPSRRRIYTGAHRHVFQRNRTQVNSARDGANSSTIRSSDIDFILICGQSCI